MTHRTFIAAILAAALAITGMTSAPARAGNDDIAKWIAGAAALAIIGAAIADANDRDDRVVTRNTTRTFDDNPKNWHRQEKARGYGQGHGHGHGNFRNQRFALPGKCLANAETRHGNVRGFDRSCLMRNYQYVNSLPNECAVRARGEHRGRVVYHGRCLRQYGYEMASRR